MLRDEQFKAAWRWRRSVLLTIVMMLGLIFLLITSAMQLSGAKAGGAAMNACFVVVPLALLVLQLVWLIQAMRGADQTMAAQYAMQYWQYAQQQQQAYAHQQQPPPIYPPQQPPPDRG